MNFLPQNNFYKQILRLALPAIAGLSTQMVLSIVDSAMIGRLEEAEVALAAMGIGVLATWALVSFFSSLATGTHVIAARRYGMRDYIGCGITLNNSLIISIAIGVFVALTGVLAAYQIGNFFASDPTVGLLAGDYLFFRFLGIPLFLISVSFRGFFFGINKTKIFMISGVITNILNIFFNYILIYGEFGFPRMGLAGAGLGSSLATLFDVVFYLTIILSRNYRELYQNFSHFKLNMKLIRRIFRLSLPVSFQNVFILIGFLIFIAIIGIIGTREQAASQAIVSLLFISLLPCFGFGIAVQTLIGNSLGSGKIKLAKIFGYETAKIATYYTILLGIIFISIPQYVLLLITTDQEIILTAKASLRIAGFAQIFYASGIVFANGLQAAGKTFFVMKAEVITNLFLFVPLAYLLGVYLQLSLGWVWLAIPLYSIVYSFTLYKKFSSDDWVISNF
jgi:multidrug resistance protein, MATE family